MPNISSFQANANIDKAKFYEVEQAAYWAMRLTLENKRRKDNLTFKAKRTAYQDVYLNPLYVIIVGNVPGKSGNQYITAIHETNGDKHNA